ncbi:hypothetical protein [Paraburkholderia humisilvae]
MRQYLTQTPLEENCWYGFLSPKFKEKTNLTSSDVYTYISQQPGDVDVVTFSPYLDQSALFLNIFEQAHLHHPGIINALAMACGKVAPGCTDPPTVGTRSDANE